MLTADQLKLVLSSADHRRSYGLDLPDASLAALNDPTTFTTFFDRWTAQGQPRYEPPAAAVPAAAVPAAVVPDAAPAAMPAAGAPPAAAPDAAPVAVMPTPVAPAPIAQSPAAPAPVAPAYQPIPDPYGHQAFAAPTYTATTYSSPNMVGATSMPYTSPNMVGTPAVGARPGLGGMLIGFGAAAVGGIITFVTWEFAAPGGTFVVAWGAIIFGLIRGVRGAIQFARG